MTKLQINLSSRPFANYALYHLAYVVIGLAGLLLLAHNTFWFFSNHGDVQQMEQEIAALQTEVDSNIREATVLGDEIDQVQRNRRFREICSFVDGRIRQRRFSWIRMLNLLQGAIPLDVKIESISPRVQQDSIKITLACMARREAAVNEFIENLEGIEEFDRVLITAEDKEGSTVTFPLTMEYSPFGFPDAPSRGAAGEGASGQAKSENAGAAPEPGSLEEAISQARLPDPDDQDFVDEVPFDPFAAGDGDLFGGGNNDFGDPVGLGDAIPMVPIPLSGTPGEPAGNDGPANTSKKTRSSGDLIKQPKNTGGRKRRPNSPALRPGGRS
jgi:Tfp pilus assembly protein PilN